MDGAQDLSPHIPHSLRPFYLVLVVTIGFLGAFIQKGPPRATPFRSVIHLIILDTCTYLLLLLSFIFLIITIIFADHDEISATLVPIFLVLVVLVHAKKTQPRRRYLYALWIAIESLCSVSNVVVDVPALLYAEKLIESHCDLSDVNLIRKEAQIDSTASSIYFKEPFLLALCTSLLHRWTSAFLDKKFKSPSNALITILKHSRCKLMERSRGNMYGEKMRVITAWTNSCRFRPHNRFGSLWYRVTHRTFVDRDAQGGWFIGSEVIQSLKHSLGLSYISSEGFYDDVDAVWAWAAKQNLDFRKRLQIEPVAEEIARENEGNVDVVITVATALAGEGNLDGVMPSSQERRMAVEANLVAVLGMIVQQVYSRLDVELLWKRVMDVFKDDMWLGERLVGRSMENWPQQEIGKIVVQWIMDACDDKV